MNVIDEINAERAFGVVHCGLSTQASPSISDLASEFGLASDPVNYEEIDAGSARRLMEMILNQDTAYNAEIIPADRAAELVQRFLSLFRAQQVRFFTNGKFHEAPGPRLVFSGAQWNPVTEATFDTGVLILDSRCSGCLWVEDED